jgi:hypothetical protein
MSSQSSSTIWRTETDLDPYNLTRYSSTIQASAPLIRTESRTLAPQRSQSRISLGSQLLTTGFELSDRILTSSSPLELNATETVTVQQTTGVHLNLSEEQTWKGSPPLSEYPINFDPNPEVVEKRLLQAPNYVQPITIKYLKPPVPARTGEITIRQEADTRVPKAPPVIIRQTPPEPFMPGPIILREQPPQSPEEIPRKYVSICGRALPPPPRRLVVEKLAQMPEKPQPIEIERWLQYGEQTRNVKFIPAEPVANWEKEKNLLILWQCPQARVTKDLRTLETINCNPDEYRRQYSNSMLTFSQMNSRLRELNVGLPEPVQTPRPLPRLEGDLEALKMIDLDRWGLSEYKYLVEERSSWVGEQGSFYDQVWSEAVVSGDGMVTPEEARRLVILLHHRL